MYQSLPPTYEAAAPILERVMQENASATLTVVGSRKRPDPPRSLIAQQGSLEALITWNAPQKMGDISAWRIYKDTESNLIDTITDVNTRQYKPKLPASTATAFYVSAINPLGIESVKVQIIATANGDQFVTAGTSGGTGGTTPSTPPGYVDEPSGGALFGGTGRRRVL